MSGAKKRERIDWIDCAKGIGIILVIVGHTVLNDNEAVHQAIRGGIFSFHMPMFFMLSAMTYRLSENRDQFVRKQEKAFRHLIVPMLCVYGLIIIIEASRIWSNLDIKAFIRDRINILIYSSGVVVNVYDAVIPALGMLWFVVVLFCGRMIYDYLQLRLSDYRTLLLAVIALTLLGVGISRVQWLPLSLDISLACLPFFWAGNKLGNKGHKLDGIWPGILSVAVWAGTLLLTYKLTHTYMELAVRRYPLFPLGYITALAGSLSVIWISKRLVRLPGTKWCVWLGRNSMILYLIHALDMYYDKIWSMFGSNAANTACRLMIDIALCILYVNCKTVLFNKRNHI